jgi:hypothetical protein
LAWVAQELKHLTLNSGFFGPAINFLIQHKKKKKNQPKNQPKKTKTNKLKQNFK